MAARSDGRRINADVKVSQGGKWYCAVDTWSPESRKKSQPSKPPAADNFDEISEIPF